MTTYPKISIITPNYNYGHFLEQTILSVIAQGYPNLEYIIIDGGSSDNSVEIIKKYEKHLAYWISEPDKGMYDAINKGFARSTGQIMAWLNSDDKYFPWSLQVVAEVFTAFKEVNWISSLQPGAMDYNGYIIDFGRFEGFSTMAFAEGRYAGTKNSFGFIQQESTFWTKELWNQAGGYLATDAGMAGDFELWCRFYKRENLYGVVSPLGIFRCQHAQQSAGVYRYAALCQKILKSASLPVTASAGSRKWLRAARIDRLPGIMHVVKKQLGYTADIIVRADRDMAKSTWGIQSKQFI